MAGRTRPHQPVWIHPADAGRFGIARTGDLVRVETAIGYLVAKAWITEGIRPGVVTAAITWAAGGSIASRAVPAA
jgi:anaerobic selenocysteine-containing dehydrogenase